MKPRSNCLYKLRILCILFLCIISLSKTTYGNEINQDENKISSEEYLLEIEELDAESRYYEQNKTLSDQIVAVFITLLFILCFLFVDNVKRRKLQKELIESSKHLSKLNKELGASEEELIAQNETIMEHSRRMDELNQKYSIAIESTDSAVWEYDRESQNLKLSKNFIRSINIELQEEDNVYNIFSLIFSDINRDKLIDEFKKYFDGQSKEINMQLPVTDMNGSKRWIVIRGRGVKDRNDYYSKAHGIVLETTKLKAQEEYIEYLAEHDYTTGLPNRYSFMECLNKELFNRGKGAVLIFDIDNFKSVNDTLGHLTGDKMLCEIANRFRKIEYKGYEVFRFGGDEFLMVLKGYHDISAIESILTKIIALFDEPIIIENAEYYVKFSIGISRYPEDDTEVEQLLMNVDRAMYEVKRKGRNSYSFYRPSMNDEMKHRLKVELILSEAVKENGFKLQYQPQINVLSGEIVSFEALIRMQHHNLSPAEFIEVAEENGIIIRIGRWVAEEAIKQLARWKMEGKVLKPIAINFSSKQMNDLSFTSFLCECFQKYDIEADYIEIEITESVLLENTESTLNYLNNLIDIGVKLTLDDFGTGYSSLNYITYLPVHKIKLDRSLCERFLSLDDNNVMKNLIALIHSLNLKITAEGIEEIKQYELLKSSHCDLVQGYLFSKPLNPEDINEIYDKNMLYRVLN